MDFRDPFIIPGCRVQDQIADNFRKLQNAVEETTRNLILDFDVKHIERALEKTRVASEHLAMLGWTLPMRLGPADLVNLAGQSAEDVDLFFVEFYTDNEFAELRLLRKELGKCKSLEQWKVLLEQCFASFESQNHLITVPALLTILDGIVFKASNSAPTWRVDPVKICAAKATAADNGIKTWMWRSLELFFGKLFESAPFDQSRPTLINRHWILHGRDAANWTSADSLRLFNALQTVDSLLE
jgi:hypothetical protein